MSRPRVHGKFLYVGDDQLWIRGVTYSPFDPSQVAYGAPTATRVDSDFASMAEKGINAVWTLGVPPRWLLDIAHRHGLYVMVGLPVPSHLTLPTSGRRLRSMAQRIREDVQPCAGHVALLGYAMGHAIPRPIAHRHGRRRIEGFLKQLYHAAKASDPEGLVTYVHDPTTTSLDLPFLDFIYCHVNLEAQDRPESYLAGLHHLAGDRPLVIATMGMGSRRQGEAAQGPVLARQIRTTFALGCAGLFILARTEAWHRLEGPLDDGDFGLMNRSPKAVLSEVCQAYAAVLFPKDMVWPPISVVVCSDHGTRTLGACLEGLFKLHYPHYEVIVVDDGSVDKTAEIVRLYSVRLVRTENRGLSNARNAGLQAAAGEIVAYIDDEAYPDPHWLMCLAITFHNTDHVGVGGPLPGCHMAFRRSTLQSIGGFDPRFCGADSDADVCWRLQRRGWTLGLSPTAIVWHRRSHSVRSGWKRQRLARLTKRLRRSLAFWRRHGSSPFSFLIVLLRGLWL